jgi:hypothetical protein
MPVCRRYPGTGRAERDRCRGAGWGELNPAEARTERQLDAFPETELFGVELHRMVLIGDRMTSATLITQVLIGSFLLDL